MSSTERLLLTDRRGRLCVLTLNRPDKKNALSLELVGTLTRKLEQLARETEAPVLVIRGAGDEAFCSGFDIRSLPAGPQRADAAEILEPVEVLSRASSIIRCR